jgi:hypothetical protein
LVKIHLEELVPVAGIKQSRQTQLPFRLPAFLVCLFCFVFATSAWSSNGNFAAYNKCMGEAWAAGLKFLKGHVLYFFGWVSINEIVPKK